MKEKLYLYKNKIIIIGTIVILIIGIKIGYNQWNQYKYNTGYGLTNTQKSSNIKVAILGQQYEKALKLTNDYYEDNDNIRLQWKAKIEKCKTEGINKFMLYDNLNDIY